MFFLFEHLSRRFQQMTSRRKNTHAVLDVTSHLLESIKIISQINNLFCSVALCRFPRTAVLIAIREVKAVDFFSALNHLTISSRVRAQCVWGHVKQAKALLTGVPVLNSNKSRLISYDET